MADENLDDMPLADASAKPAKQNPLIPLLVVLIAMPAAAVGVFKFVIEPSMAHTIEEAATGQSPEAEKYAIEKLKNMQKYEISDLMTNIGGNEPRYIRVKFFLEGSNPQFTSIIESADARVRDSAIGILQSLSVQDAMQGGIKNIVASEMVSQINKSLSPAPAVVENIYFTEFVIQ